MKALKIILASAICCAFVYAEEVKVENVPAPAPSAKNSFENFDVKNKEFQAKRSDLMKEMQNLNKEQKDYFVNFTKDMNEDQKKEFFSHLKENRKANFDKNNFRGDFGKYHGKKMKKFKKMKKACGSSEKMSHMKKEAKGACMQGEMMGKMHGKMPAKEVSSQAAPAPEAQ